MINKDNAMKVAATLAANLGGVSSDAKNFERLPDSFWGYYARGHDSGGVFGMIVMYSEDETNIDNIIKMYEEWLKTQHSARD